MYYKYETVVVMFEPRLLGNVVLQTDMQLLRAQQFQPLSFFCPKIHFGRGLCDLIVALPQDSGFHGI